MLRESYRISPSRSHNLGRFNQLLEPEVDNDTEPGLSLGSRSEIESGLMDCSQPPLYAGWAGSCRVERQLYWLITTLSQFPRARLLLHKQPVIIERAR